MQKVKNTFTKMNKDVSVMKHQPEIYYDAKNISVLTEGQETSFIVSNKSGNSHLFDIPQFNLISGVSVSYLFNGQSVFVTANSDNTSGLPTTYINNFNQVIGYEILENELIFITVTQIHDVNGIWVYNFTNNQLRLVAVGKLNITLDSPIRRIITIKENNEIKRIYFTDNKNILRSLNYADPNVLLYPNTSLDITPDNTLEEINTLVISGGSFETGLVSYAYTLVDVNGSETKISPLTKLISVNTFKTGSTQSSIVNRAVELRLNNLPDFYTQINVYRIHYNSESAVPKISLIDEKSVNGNYFHTDDGSVSLEDISIQELISLGNDPFICKDIQAKDNRLFAFNITRPNFDFDFDARAYSFSLAGNALIQDNNLPDIIIDKDNPDWNIPQTFDSINPSTKAESNYDRRINLGNTNPNYMLYMFQRNSLEFGGNGPNISYKLIKNYVPVDELSIQSNINTGTVNEGVNRNFTHTFEANNFYKQNFKTDEVYRLAIRFKNKKGQYSFAKWIADVRIPNANILPLSILDPTDNRIKLLRLNIEVTITNTTSIPNDVVGYEILRVETTNINRTILAQGYLNTTVKTSNLLSDNDGIENLRNRNMVNYSQRFLCKLTNGLPSVGNSVNNTFLQPINNAVNNTTQLRSLDYELNFSGAVRQHRQNANVVQFYTPDLDKIPNIQDGVYYNVLGGYKFKLNKSTTYVGSINSQTAEGSFSALANSFRAPMANNNNSSLVVARKGLEYVGSKTGSPNNTPIFAQGITTETMESTLNAPNNIIEFPDGRTDTFLNVNFTFSNKSNNNVRAYRTNGAKSLITQINQNDDNINGLDRIIGSPFISSNANDYFFSSTVWNNLANDEAILPIADYKRELPNQYGGNSYEAIQRTADYIPCSEFTPITQNISIAYGDTFLTYFTSYRSISRISNDLLPGTMVQDVIIVPIESFTNEDLRIDAVNDNYFKIKDISQDWSTINQVNKTYSRQNFIVKSLGKPFNFKLIEKFSNQIIGSDSKINGEIIDSYLKFRPNDFIDAEAKYGEITSACLFNNNVFVFQPYALSLIRISPKILVQDLENTIIQQGTGKLLESVDTITDSSGTSLQYSVCKTPFGIMYYDDMNFEIKLFTGESNQPISTLEGMYSWLKNNINVFNNSFDNPYNNQGVLITHNTELKESYISFYGGNNLFQPLPNYTLVYKHLTQGFDSFIDNYKKSSINVNKLNLELHPNLRSFWKFDKNVKSNYFNETFNSEITFIVNDNVDFTKIAENLLYNSKVTLNGQDIPLETLSHIRVYNDYQDSGIQPINSKRKFREWRVELPRQINTRNKIRGQYFYVTLYFTNNSNKLFELSDIITNYTLLPASFI